MAYLLYQGHGSYRIESDAGLVLYVDPYAGEGYDLPADLILVSHEHFDHSKIELVNLKPGGKIYRSVDLLINGAYRMIDCGEVHIEATPAYNSHHSKTECIGFLIWVDNRIIYAAGDTSTTTFMAERLAKEPVDYAILPIDGLYNMGAEEASRCAEVIGAKHSIPIHMKPGALFDEKMAHTFHAEGRIILHPGEKIAL